MAAPDRAVVARSTAWVAAASGALGVLDLISTLLCVRLWVTKADFGAATIAIALFPILDRLGGMGFGAALVREPEAEDSVFWVNLGTAMVMAAALVGVHLASGSIIASLVAAYGARLVVQAFSVVPEARMKRALRFHELSIIRVIAGVADTATKLGLAASGEPIWCFIAGPLVNTGVTTVAIQLRCRWRPRARFDRAVAARATRFTAALSGGELLYYVYTSADYLVVGAAFGDAAVGVYRLAYELVIDVVRLISMITAEVAYPVFVQTPRDELAGAFARFTRQNLIALVPFLAVVAIAGGPLLGLLYGPMPAEAATASRILCIVGALRALGFVIPPLLAALGRADRVLAYHAVAAVVMPGAFAIAAHLGSDFTAVAWAWAIGYPIAFAILLAFALAALPLSLTNYVRSIARPGSTAAPVPGTAPPPGT